MVLKSNHHMIDNPCICRIVPLRIQYTEIHPYEVFAGRSRRGHSLSDNKMLDPGHQKSNALARSDGDPLLHLQRVFRTDPHTWQLGVRRGDLQFYNTQQDDITLKNGTTSAKAEDKNLQHGDCLAFVK